MKTTKITPELFDCDIVRKERMKLYMEMAEYFGGKSRKKYGWGNSICFKLPQILKTSKYDIDFLIWFPELGLIKAPLDETVFGGYWFDPTTSEGQLERSTALLFVYYAMGGK